MKDSIREIAARVTRTGKLVRRGKTETAAGKVQEKIGRVEKVFGKQESPAAMWPPESRDHLVAPPKACLPSETACLFVDTTSPARVARPSRPHSKRRSAQDV